MATTPSAMLTISEFESRAESLAYRDGYSQLVQEMALGAETGAGLCVLLFLNMRMR